jgi:hypothetical protein
LHALRASRERLQIPFYSRMAAAIRGLRDEVGEALQQAALDVPPA